VIVQRRNEIRIVARKELFMRVPSLCVVILVALAFLTGGCKSDKDATNKPVVSSLKDLRADMVDCKTAVDKTQASLAELSTTPDIKATYEKLNKSVANLNEASTDLREQAAEMRARSEVYIARWKDEMDQVSDPDIKASAAQRREAVAANFSKIRDTAGGARSAYATYNTSLQAIQTALKNDLTPGGVNMLGTKIKKTQGEGETLKNELDKLIGELDQLKAGMSTTRPVAAPK
jgi:predicted nuclease with TOPRIM domain